MSVTLEQTGTNTIPSRSAFILRFVSTIALWTIALLIMFPGYEILFWHDFGELLYSLGVLGWLMLVTLPAGALAFVFWLIVFILHRTTWRKRVAAGFPPPIPLPPSPARVA